MNIFKNACSMVVCCLLAFDVSTYNAFLERLFGKKSKTQYTLT